MIHGSAHRPTLKSSLLEQKCQKAQEKTINKIHVKHNCDVESQNGCYFLVTKRESILREVLQSSVLMNISFKGKLSIA